MVLCKRAKMGELEYEHQVIYRIYVTQIEFATNKQDRC